MPSTRTATFDKKYLLRILNFEIDDEHLAAQISKMGLNVEEIDKDNITIEFSPNRPDIMGIHGFARALKNFMHKSTKYRYEIVDNGSPLEIGVGAAVHKIRPFISAFVVKDIEFDNESLTAIINFTDKFSETYGRRREKLAMGLHNLDTIIPPITYDAFKDSEFVPLNKSQKMKYSDFISKEKKGGKYGHIGVGKTGDRYVALKDREGTLSLIPIINSERTRVTKSTRNLLVDITGTLNYTVDKAADMFAAEFMDMGGHVERVLIKYGKESILLPKMESQSISIPVSQAEKEIGVKIGHNNVVSLANKMGYDTALIGKMIRFRVPEYRMDVINEQDIIEDIAIGYGYEYIKPMPIESIQKGSLEERTRRLSRIRIGMLGLGFSEQVSSYLTNEEINFKNMLDRETGIGVRIRNPKTNLITMLRTSLLPSLLISIGKSVHEKMPQKLFEIDMAFSVKDDVVKEMYHVAGIMTDSKANFNDIKAVFEALTGMMKLDYTIVQYNRESFIEGRCAGVVVDGKEAGFFGEVHPQVLNNFGIEEPTVAFELSI